MLVLSRRIGEALVIGEYIVRVTDIRGDKVRLGVQAPKDVPIHRLEIQRKIEEGRRGQPLPHLDGGTTPGSPV